jgi:hypothetical protein
MSIKEQVDKDRQLAVALKRMATLKRSACFDPFNLDSVPTPGQLAILQDISAVPHRYVLGGNQSGKSMTGGREASWIFTETHPYWKRDPSWGAMPLTQIVIGRTTTQVEEEIWGKKIKPFLDPSEYKEVRVSSSLQKVIHRKNGNTILFFSHHNPEEAREKVQSFLSHWVWLDEMPNSVKLLEELHRRCQAYLGARFLATFTPKLRNNEIRKLIDTPTDYHKKYKIGMLDNPIYVGREEAILAPLSGLPEQYRNTVLSGDWWLGDTAVYDFDSARHCARLPDHYSPTWRHVEAIDPAAAGKAGYVQLAEEPTSGVWYVIRATYIQGASATTLLSEVTKLNRSVNLVRRVSDPHETWFIKQAAEEGHRYVGVYNKAARKKELIKNLQERLNDGYLKIMNGMENLVNEFTSCQWSETTQDKIVGATRFHILDALQYAVDNLPKRLDTPIPQSFDEYLRQANRKWRVEAEKVKQKKGRIARGRRHA